MKTSEVYTCYSSEKGERYEIEEYSQPFWAWLKGSFFHGWICATEQRWTQWFWHRNWYRMVFIDSETDEKIVDWAPLCTWMDIKCYHLRNDKKYATESREITKKQYEAHR